MLDVTGPHWQHLTVNHGEQALKDYNFDKPRELRKLFIAQKDVSGIYAYYLAGKCLYVGKSINFQDRIYNHFLTSCNLTEPGRYREFFSKNCGTMDLYILPLGMKNREGEFLRTVVEKILEVHLKPEMESIKL